MSASAICASRPAGPRNRYTVICLLAAATILAGCGSGSSTTTNRTSTGAASDATARRAFRSRVNAVCARAVTVHAGHEFPVPGFDAEHPDPSQLPRVADYFARYGGLPATTAALHTLTPPQQDAPVWRHLLGIADHMTANVQQQIAAARTRDVAAFVTTVHTADRLIDQLNAAAAQLGYSDTSPCLQVFG